MIGILVQLIIWKWILKNIMSLGMLPKFIGTAAMIQMSTNVQIGNHSIKMIVDMKKKNGGPRNPTKVMILMEQIRCSGAEKEKESEKAFVDHFVALAKAKDEVAKATAKEKVNAIGQMKATQFMN